VRKLSFFILISFIFIGFMNAATIKVEEPHAGDIWYKGHTYNITWTKTGNAGVNVKINIFRNSIIPANFVEQLTGPNSGSKSWPIASSYANGTYYIRIKGVDSSWNDTGVYGDSEYFSIKKKLVFPSIKKIKMQPIPLCTIMEANPIFTSSDKVTFRVKYSFSPSAAISIADRPARYRLVANVPNSKSAGRLYFSCTASPFQGIPIGQEKLYTIDVIYGSDHNQPPIFKSGTVEFIILSIYNSEKPLCSKKIDFYHEWHH